jgi:hypothetical protein
MKNLWTFVLATLVIVIGFASTLQKEVSVPAVSTAPVKADVLFLDKLEAFDKNFGIAYRWASFALNCPGNDCCCDISGNPRCVPTDECSKFGKCVSDSRCAGRARL